MRSTRIFGFMMLTLAISLIFLLNTKFPNVKRKSFPLKNPLELPTGAHNLFNLTLQPTDKKDYHIEVAISPVGSPIHLDFWVVNSTWIGPFLEFMDWYFFEYGHAFREDYPDRGAFKMIPAYVKEINITGPKRIDMVVDHDGVYCFVFINFFDVKQYVSVDIEEQYLDSAVPYRSILEPNLVNFSITFAIAAAGAYCLAKDSRKRAKRKRFKKFNMLFSGIKIEG